MASEAKKAYSRATPRFPTMVNGKVRKLGTSEWNECRVLNLSLGGACVATELPLEMGSMLELVVPREPPHNDHRVKGKVTWVNGAEFGVQFVTKL